jgi:hypothetical protein
METVIGRADLGDELEGGVGLVLGALDRVGGGEQGMGRVGAPKGSPPFPQKLCQYETAYRSQLSRERPATTRLAS